MLGNICLMEYHRGDMDYFTYTQPCRVLGMVRRYGYISTYNDTPPLSPYAEERKAIRPKALPILLSATECYCKRMRSDSFDA